MNAARLPAGAGAEAEEPAGETETKMNSPELTVPLYRLAHGRTGDKGDRSNISVIAWHPALWPVLLAQLTPQAVAAHFAHRQPARVQRFELPRLQALNFVLDAVLDGGVNDALNLDTHGKSLSFWLLDMPVRVPVSLQMHLAGP